MDAATISMILGAALISVIAYFLTKPLDIRDQRWPCIVMSVPLICLVISIFMVPIAGNSGALAPGIGAILAIGGLGFVWKGVLGHYASGGVVHLIMGNSDART